MSTKGVNILRTAAGIESLMHLHEVQSLHRNIAYGDDANKRAVAIHTRRKPQRADELLNGGSVFWIIKHMIKARQSIIDIEIFQDEQGKDYCRILVEPQIILTQGITHRAIQGWRYLASEKAPKDIGVFDPDNESFEDIPEELAKDLREIALI